MVSKHSPEWRFRTFNTKAKIIFQNFHEKQEKTFFETRILFKLIYEWQENFTENINSKNNNEKDYHYNGYLVHFIN